MIHYNGELVVPLGGGYPVPAEALRRGMLVSGVSGAGKTLFYNWLLRVLLTPPTTLLRLLSTDSKTENVSLLRSLGVDPVLLHPYDKRSRLVDFCELIRLDSTLANTVAEALLPDSGGSKKDSHWIKSARLMLAGILKALAHLAPFDWGIDDVFKICRLETAIKRTVALCPSTQHLTARIRDDEEWASVFATISTRLDPLDSLAAAWGIARKGGRTVSLLNWCVNDPAPSESCLLLGQDDSRRTSCSAAASTIIGLATKLLMSSSQAGEETASTVFALDEFPTLANGPIDGFGHFLNTARSRGIANIIGIQCRRSLDADWGVENTDVLLGNLGTVVAYRSSSAMAAYLAGLAGKCEELIEKHTFSNDEKSNSTTVGPEIRPTLLDSEFMHLEFPSAYPGGCAPGWYFYNSQVWKHEWPFEEWPARPDKMSSSQNYQPIPPSELQLEPLTSDDLQRLNLGTSEEALADFGAAAPLPWE